MVMMKGQRQWQTTTTFVMADNDNYANNDATMLMTTQRYHGDDVTATATATTWHRRWWWWCNGDNDGNCNNAIARKWQQHNRKCCSGNSDHAVGTAIMETAIMQLGLQWCKSDSHMMASNNTRADINNVMHKLTINLHINNYSYYIWSGYHPYISPNQTIRIWNVLSQCDP